MSLFQCQTTCMIANFKTFCKKVKASSCFSVKKIPNTLSKTCSKLPVFYLILVSKPTRAVGHYLKVQWSVTMICCVRLQNHLLHIKVSKTRKWLSRMLCWRRCSKKSMKMLYNRSLLSRLNRKSLRSNSFKSSRRGRSWLKERLRLNLFDKRN